MQDILIGAGKLVDNHTVKYSLPGKAQGTRHLHVMQKEADVAPHCLPLAWACTPSGMSVMGLRQVGQQQSRGNHERNRSLTGFHIEVFGWASGRVDVGGTVTARDIIIATGSVPFVPPGIPIDGKTVRGYADPVHLPACTCFNTLCTAQCH